MFAETTKFKMCLLLILLGHIGCPFLLKPTQFAYVRLFPKKSWLQTGDAVKEVADGRRDPCPVTDAVSQLPTWSLRC